MKRYVLLEDKTIVDTNKSDKYKIAENTLWHNSMLQGTILNQSDNLIDLAEVGDCVECNYGLYNETYSINNDTQLNAFKGDNTVVAIWKRDGDVMRRYEV